MSYTYSQRKHADRGNAQQEAAPAQPSLDALRSGAAAPTQEQMGHRVDLPDAMRSKMEDAFGADLSAVKLYESEAVADAGANAVARGADIAFAPGLLDFTSFGGQALLGHEISHVVSQARGEVTGGGFLNDHALEARADTEGAMAAAGQQVAMPAAAMSGVTAAAAAGPMQADKASNKANQARDEQASTVYSMLQMQKKNPGYANDPEYAALQKTLSKAQAKDAKWSKRLSPDAKLPSAGLRTLDYLHEKHYVSKGVNNAFSYFEDADTAMDILGSEPDDSMRDRLSEQTAEEIRNAQGRLAYSQNQIAFNHERGSYGANPNYTYTPGEMSQTGGENAVRDVLGINKLKQFAFKRKLDLGDQT